MRLQDVDDYLKGIASSPKRTLGIVALLVIVAGGSAWFTSVMSEAGKKVVQGDSVPVELTIGTNAKQQQQAAEQARLEAAAYEKNHAQQVICMEETVAADREAGHTYGFTLTYVSHARELLKPLCPSEFNQLYFDHLNAWEDRITAANAIDTLNSSDNVGKVVVNQVLCKMLNCPDESSPITLAKNQVDTLIEMRNEADKRIKTTWNDVLRYAIGEGATIPSA